MTNLSINSKVFVIKEVNHRTNRKSNRSFNRQKEETSFIKNGCEKEQFHDIISKPVFKEEDQINDYSSNNTNYTTDSFNSCSDQECNSELSETEQEMSPSASSCNYNGDSEGENTYLQNNEIYTQKHNSCKKLKYPEFIRSSDCNIQTGKYEFSDKESFNYISQNKENIKLSLQGDKKRNRRAGRKQKRMQNQNSDEILNSDQESQKYKTEMCKNWLEKGKCRYSVRCRFAHGYNEISQGITIEKPVLYKSKKCNAFHKDLYCPYGARCKFIHEEATQEKVNKNYFSMNFMLLQEPGKAILAKRLPVFQGLTGEV